MQDHYATLKVDRHASAEQIRAAYRSAARRLHPDVCTLPNAEQLFAQLAKAYQVLADPAQRRAYDAQTAARTTRATPTAPRAGRMSWTNIASPTDRVRNGARAPETDRFEELYDAFFQSQIDRHD